MSHIYDNWERLVAAAVKKQQLWELFHQQSRSPSLGSEASDATLSYSSSNRHLTSSPVSSSQWHESSHPQMVFVSDINPSFEILDMYLSSTELPANGTFGSVFTSVVGNGVKVFVKRLTSEITSELEFKRIMEVVRDVKHENVVPLRGYYCDKDERLMFYDHYSQGSVYALLYGQTNGNQTPIDLEFRLRVAIGAARGIAEIHKQQNGSLVHGNIKAENIFMNSQNYGCVSDLGLGNMIATAYLPVTSHYAPEMIGKSQNVTQASDVYSFGILILELLTTKSPVYIHSDPETLDLVKLVASIKNKESRAKVFDADLLKNHNKNGQMMKLLQIGVRCVARSPNKRPRIFEVVNMLEELNDMMLKVS